MGPNQTPEKAQGQGAGAGGDGETMAQIVKRARWAEKTDALLVEPEDIQQLRRNGAHVVGVTGFSGQWKDANIEADPVLKQTVAEATAAIEALLRERQKQYGSNLVVSSGATMEGVPKIVYEVCERLGIAAMGVTTEKAHPYPLGKMRFLIVKGEDWGQESATFLATSDEILILGGGGQAKREAIAASESGLPLTVFRGYGGSADALGENDVPGANVVKRAANA